MKRAYLLLVTTAAVAVAAAVGEPQRTNNDIIWYPVDDEDGVFISTFGEKHRTAGGSKWRSHRRARYSGNEDPGNFPLLPYGDPSENEDPSFFHNIRERRPQSSGSLMQRPPPPARNRPFPNNPFLGGLPDRPSSQGRQPSSEENIQEIINEIFDPRKPLPGQRPGSGDRWGSSPQRPPDDDYPPAPLRPQGFGRPDRPEKGSQWGGNPSFPRRPLNDEWFDRPSGVPSRPQRPGTGGGSQWGGNAGASLPQRPPDSEWINRPGDSFHPQRPARPSTESDKLVFPDQAIPTRPSTEPPTTSSSDLLPTEAPTMSPCERKCPVTPEFNPVCGSDMVTYSNAGRLKCARACGKDVVLAHYGSCGRTRFITPLLSANESPERVGFW